MRNTKLLLILMLTVLLAACGSEQNNPWCDGHRSIHSQHEDIVTKVNIDYSESGELVAQLDIPQIAASREALTDTSQVIEASAAAECKSFPADIGTHNQRWIAKYRIECGADNRLKQASVVLLNNFADIAEVEAIINTPAATKHFVLNRQCDRPIFMQ